MGTICTKISEEIYLRVHEDPDGLKTTKIIEKDIEKYKQEHKNTIKLLLLGSGNSGKSTVAKQFKIIHKFGFTAEDRRQFRDAIWLSSIQSMKALVLSVQDLLLNQMQMTNNLLDRDNEDYGEETTTTVDEAALQTDDFLLTDGSLPGGVAVSATGSTGGAGVAGGGSFKGISRNQMQCYQQFLLHHVRNEMGLFEEVEVPIVVAPLPPTMSRVPPSSSGSPQPESAAPTTSASGSGSRRHHHHHRSSKHKSSGGEEEGSRSKQSSALNPTNNNNNNNNIPTPPPASTPTNAGHGSELVANGTGGHASSPLRSHAASPGSSSVNSSSDDNHSDVSPPSSFIVPKGPREGEEKSSVSANATEKPRKQAKNPLTPPTAIGEPTVPSSTSSSAITAVEVSASSLAPTALDGQSNARRKGHDGGVEMEEEEGDEEEEEEEREDEEGEEEEEVESEEDQPGASKKSSSSRGAGNGIDENKESGGGGGDGVSTPESKQARKTRRREREGASSSASSGLLQSGDKTPSLATSPPNTTLTPTLPGGVPTSPISPMPPTPPRQTGSNAREEPMVAKRREIRERQRRDDEASGPGGENEDEGAHSSNDEVSQSQAVATPTTSPAGAPEETATGTSSARSEKKHKKTKRKKHHHHKSSSSSKSNRDRGDRGERGGESRGLVPKPPPTPTVTWETMTIGRLLQKVWVDPLIQRVYAREEKMPQLEAPLEFYMRHMDRIAQRDFQPTNEDILMARKRTVGVNLIEFENGGHRFQLIDVGGQRTERRKWLAHFDNVDAVLFVVGLDQYDQIMMEDGTTNRLRDSMALFEEICTSPWFRYSNFILFLNKCDLFRTQIKQVPLTVCFKSYVGDPHDYDGCVKYIKKRFEGIHARYAQLLKDELARTRTRRLETLPSIYPYLTCATDTQAMKFVLQTCQEIVLKNELASAGLMSM